jgi:hypothetical protein
MAGEEDERCHQVARAVIRPPGAFLERRELGPGDLRVHGAEAREGAEAAVRAGHHPVLAEDLGEPLEALAHEVRVLDEVGGRVHHAGNEDLVVRHLPARSRNTSHS